MNDGIGKDLVSLSYVSVDEVVAGIIRGTLLAQMDIRQAYRNVPIHPSDSWHAMAGGDICRCDATFWAEISSVDLLNYRRCTAGGYGVDGHGVGCPLH